MRISDWSSDVCSSDLQARVHFEEVEALARRVGARDDQLDRARAIVADGLRQRDALFAHGLAHLFGHEGRRRLLDHLLVAALDAAFALVEVEDVAVLVSEDSSEEHTSELQSLMRNSYAVFCLKKKKSRLSKVHEPYV